jgi:septum formation protein
MGYSKFNLVLGSQSPRRKELLSWLNIPFKIVTADLDEISNEKDPASVAMDIAHQKGRTVFNKIISIDDRSFVIASDTIVVLDDVIYGKPKDRLDAKRILNELSGKTHLVITGVSFLFKNNDGKVCEHQFYDQTEVHFNEITPDLMENYLNTGDSLDKAGAYGIQGPSLTFISKLNGSYSNVVGFPLDKIVEELRIILGEHWRSFFE